MLDYSYQNKSILRLRTQKKNANSATSEWISLKVLENSNQSLDSDLPDLVNLVVFLVLPDLYPHCLICNMNQKWSFLLRARALLKDSS